MRVKVIIRQGCPIQGKLSDSLTCHIWKDYFRLKGGQIL